MGLRGLFSSWVEKNLVVILVALPNLAITTGTVTLLSYFWHWSFVFAPTVYYLVGQVFSVQYSSAFNTITDMTFTVRGHPYHFSKRQKAPRVI